MNLEEQITRGIVSCISSIEHDRAQRRITIKFLKDPEEHLIDRILTFSGVEDFSEEELEDEDVEADINVVDSLIGLDEYPEAGSVLYVVHTELRELVFRTKEKPQIEVV